MPTDPKAALGPSPGYTQLQQLYWINATPMETNFASVADARLPSPNSSLPPLQERPVSFNKVNGKAVFKPPR